MKEKVQNGLRRMQSALLWVAAFGLVWQLDESAADPLIPKTVWFAAAAAGMAAAALGRFWWGARLALPAPNLRRAMLALLAVLIVSFYSSDHHALAEVAWNGWLLVALLFTAGLDWFSQDREGVDRFLESAVAALLFCVGWQGLQAAGADPSPWGMRYQEQFGGRMAAGLGNPNFLAGLLVLLAPLGLARFWNHPWRYKAGLSLLALGWMGALATASKAAVIAVGFQFFCLGHLWWHSDQPAELRRKGLKLWAACGVALFSVSLALPGLGRRLWEMATLQSDSIGFRLHTFAGAFRLWLREPLLGTGPGTFFVAYPSVRSAESMRGAMRHSYEVTHPENFVLEMLSDTGLLGLAAFAWLAWLIGRPLWRRAHQLAASNQEGGLALGLCLALGGSLVMNLAALDLFLPSTFWFFALAAAIAAARFGTPPRAISIQPETYASMVLSTVLLFMALFATAQSAGRWAASRELESGKRLARQAQFEPALARLQAAVALDPANPEARYFLAQASMDLAGRQPQQAPQLYQQAEEELDKLASMAPNYILIHAQRGRLHAQQGRFEESAQAFARQIELDPYYWPAWEGYLTGLFKSGKAMDAELNRALEYFPRHAPLWRMVAAWRLRQGDQAGALSAMRRARDLGADDAELIKAIGQLEGGGNHE